MNSFSSIAWDQNYFGCIPLVAKSLERNKISFNIHWFMLFRPNSEHTKSCAYFWHCQPHSTNIFYHNIWYYTVHQQSFKCKRAYQMLSIISTEIIHTHTKRIQFEKKSNGSRSLFIIQHQRESNLKGWLWHFSSETKDTFTLFLKTCMLNWYCAITFSIYLSNY